MKSFQFNWKSENPSGYINVSDKIRQQESQRSEEQNFLSPILLINMETVLKLIQNPYQKLRLFIAMTPLPQNECDQCKRYLSRDW